MQKQKTHYSKHWVDVPTQIRVLESRGLVIGNPQSAAEFLSYINYYRFTGYCLRFQNAFDANGNRLFAKGTAFEDVRDLCAFDKALRDVFADGLEMIEISIKAATADVFGGAYDSATVRTPADFPCVLSSCVCVLAKYLRPSFAPMGQEPVD